jgi:hypothetical protein
MGLMGKFLTTISYIAYLLFAASFCIFLIDDANHVTTAGYLAISALFICIAIMPAMLKYLIDIGWIE